MYNESICVVGAKI